MEINKKKLKHSFLMLAILPFALGAVHQSEIYSINDQKLIKRHLFNNIATEENTFIKNCDIYSVPGAVMASPSLGGPGFSQDYQFHWTRDAALTMQHLLSQYQQAQGEDKLKLKKYLLNYIHFEEKAQKQPSRPGEETLGQPKFNINTTVWEGEWGRPQNDGPALRAIALITIASEFLKEGEMDLVHQTLVPMIELDLEYLSNHWQDKNYGLWEEVFDQDHFFNKAVQRKAFQLAANFYIAQGNDAKARSYLLLAEDISASLAHHWNDALGYYSETINQQYYKGGGLNSSVLLAALYGGDDAGGQMFSISDDKLMSTVYYLRGTFASLYSINLENRHYAPLLGRYANDIYDGNQFLYGNPWVLISHAMAEYYYRLAYYYWQQREINVTDRNINFFNQIHADLVSKPGIIHKAEGQKYSDIISALIDEGDRYLESVKRFAACGQDDCLHFAEQIDRKTGQPVSAKDLSWSYSSLLSAIDWRKKVTESVLKGSV